MCLPQENVTAIILSGASVILPVNATTFPLEDDRQYCFTVPDHNIDSGRF